MKEAIHGLPEHDHLLFQPRGNPSELLGRTVTRSADGKLTIADEVAPGCKVRPRSRPERWKRTYVENLKRVVAGGAEFGDVAKLQAKYGAEARVEVDIQNTERIDADIDGDCGERFISSVGVGTGARSVSTRTEAGGEGGVKALGMGAQAVANQDHDEATNFSWDEPEAWVFTVAAGGHGPRMDISAEMPTELVDGQTYHIAVKPNREAWLLVYYVEENGQPGKLLPNEENPTIAVAENERRVLPELQVGLNDPTRATQEVMYVCGFDSVDYVRDFAPPRGEPSAAQMQEWFKGFNDQLQQLGKHHYECESIAYRIQPAGKKP
jgi:hypothetical protein